MHIYIFSFTRQASDVSLKLWEHWKRTYDCTCYTLQKFATQDGLHAMQMPLKELVGNCFSSGNVLIFVSACGIAVRSIAPFIEHKTKDPCVLVIDENASFVISLLSGHIGGGNRFTRQTAELLHAVPVISTATDLHGQFAVDEFAAVHHLSISDMKLAKRISSTLLAGNPVGYLSSYPLSLSYENIYPQKECPPFVDTGFCITPYYMNSDPFLYTLYLVPKAFVLGVGCKKNTPVDTLLSFVHALLSTHHIRENAIAAITSIDLKKDEPAMLALSQELQVPFYTYSAKTLRQVKGSSSASAFVASVTGVDNVCERASLAFHADSHLIVSKTCGQGVTAAIAEMPVRFTNDTYTCLN